MFVVSVLCKAPCLQSLRASLALKYSIQLTGEREVALLRDGKGWLLMGAKLGSSTGDRAKTKPTTETTWR